MVTAAFNGLPVLYTYCIFAEVFTFPLSMTVSIWVYWTSRTQIIFSHVTITCLWVMFCHLVRCRCVYVCMYALISVCTGMYAYKHLYSTFQFRIVHRHWIHRPVCFTAVSGFIRLKPFCNKSIKFCVQHHMMGYISVKKAKLCCKIQQLTCFCCFKFIRLHFS